MVWFWFWLGKAIWISLRRLGSRTRLAEQGVSVVIASGMGSRAQSLFQQNQIQVIIGALEDDPEKAVRNYLNGRLATGDNICDH